MNLRERCVCGQSWEVSYLNHKHTEDFQLAIADRDDFRRLHAPHADTWFYKRLEMAIQHGSRIEYVGTHDGEMRMVEQAGDLLPQEEE